VLSSKVAKDISARVDADAEALSRQMADIFLRGITSKGSRKPRKG